MKSKCQIASENNEGKTLTKILLDECFKYYERTSDRREIFKEKYKTNVNFYQFAKITGSSTATIYKALNTKSNITADVFFRIAAACGNFHYDAARGKISISVEKTPENEQILQKFKNCHFKKRYVYESDQAE